MKEFYKTYGITLYHLPINDYDDKNLMMNLQHRVNKLKHILDDSNSRVYVHCTDGITRSTSVIITYLCQNQGKLKKSLIIHKI